MTVLGSGNVQNYEYGMAIDANNLYWANNAQVMRQPLDGGSPEVLATSAVGWAISGIVVDPTSVYWADGVSIMKTPIAGGASVQLAPGNANSLAVDGDRVYWGESSNAAVMSVPLDGGPPTAWVGTSGVGDIAVDDTSIYWTDSRGLWELPKSGSPLVRLSPLAWNQAIALDSTTVYFTTLLDLANPQNGSDAVMMVPK